MSTQRSGWPAYWWSAVVTIAALAASVVILEGQITVPNTFVNHTTADATQVNANFNALAVSALNRTGGTMTGTLNSQSILPSVTATYPLGSSSFKFTDGWFSASLNSATLAVTGVTTINTQAYTWPSSQTASGFLQTNGSGTLAWTSAASLATDYGVCDLRLTATSGTPVTIADVTAAANVYVSPLQGGRCGFYDGVSSWAVLANTEVTIAVPATTATLYDVWCRNNAGTIACDTTAWSSDTARATALTTQNNIYVKTGDTTRRYIGSFRTTSVSGQTEDSVAKRYVWSYYHRVGRVLRVTETTDNWSYSTNTYRQARLTATNQLDFVIGVAEIEVDAAIVVSASSNNVTSQMWVAIGEDSTTTADTNCLTGSGIGFNIGIPTAIQRAELRKSPAVGRHTWVWLEKANTGTITWYGDNAADGTLSGIHGRIEG